jgi:hypothetical protein
MLPLVSAPFDLPRLLAQINLDPFWDWLIKAGGLSQLGLTGFVYLWSFFAIIVLWKRVIPYYVDKKWPAEQAVRDKRALAEIEMKKLETENQRLMRDAVDGLRNLQGQMMLLLDQHDMYAKQGIASIERLLAVVLEKQGVQPSEVQRLIDASVRDTAAVTEAAKKLIELLPRPASGEVKSS